jgi:hypothetical protein
MLPARELRAAGFMMTGMRSGMGKLTAQCVVITDDEAFIGCLGNRVEA